MTARPVDRAAVRCRVGLTVLVAAGLGAAALAGCGGDDDSDDRVDTDDPGSGAGPAEPAEAELTLDLEQVGSSLRIGWTVTNEGDTDLLVFDNRQADDSPDDDLADAYVTGRDDGTVEIARRVFPVPDGVEVDGQQAGTLAVEIAPGQSASGRELVLLPPQYNPAAPEGGGEPPSDDPSTAVFCVGVGPADAIDASQSAADAGERYFVRHTEANADQQTLLCGDPIDL